MTIGHRIKRFLNDLPSWAQVGLVLGVVTLISLLYPSGARFDYAYEEGQRWRYEDLFAPFDFVILKTPAELRREREQTRQRADPYFAYRAEVAATEIAAFRSAFASTAGELRPEDGYEDLQRRPGRYVELGVEALREQYERGIAQGGTPYESPANGVLNVVRGGRIMPRTPSQLPPVEQAVAGVRRRLRSSDLPDVAFVMPLIEDALQPNVVYSDSLSSHFLEVKLSQIVPSRGVVNEGDLIVTADGIVTADIARKLDSFRARYEAEVRSEISTWLIRAGYFLLTALIMGVLLLYIRVFHPGEFAKFNRLAFVLTLILAISVAVGRVDALERVSVYIIPFAAVPIVVRSFLPAGLALFAHVSVVLIATLLTGLGFEFALLHLMAGLVAVLSPSGLRDWSRIIRSLAMVTATYLVGFVGLQLVNEGGVRDWDLLMLQWLGAGIFLTLIAYPLVPLLGRLFGFTSEVDLLSLADVSRPVLQRLAARAPGTMQHSLAVGNLAESAARDIGADALLVRTAALYHDIGKAVSPEYFIENQAGANLHDALEPRTSAEVIIAHVDHGRRMAREAGLPASLLSFIATHHGTTRVEYFYRREVAEREGEDVDDAPFRYPGPLPRTKEEGILMLADSVEAASRSMREPSPKKLDALVGKIVASKLKDGQLDDCALTVAEVSAVRESLRRSLRGVFHARVEYPSDLAADAEAGPPATAEVDT